MNSFSIDDFPKNEKGPIENPAPPKGIDGGNLDTIRKDKKDPSTLVLEVLKKGGDWTLREVANETSLPLTTVKEVFSDMEGSGMVERLLTGLADPDERYCYSLLYEVMDDGQLTY